MPTVAAVVVSALRADGVQTLLGVPGGGSDLDIIAAAGHAGLPFVLTSTETAAALSAVAQAESTGRPGACLTTLGPGVASVVNGVACAFLDRAPLVVFTDTHPTAAAGAFAHQRLDQAALLRPITKFTATLSADNVSNVLDCAIRTGAAHPAGPVHILCPGDVASATSVGDGGAGDLRPSGRPPSPPATSVPAQLARAR